MAHRATPANPASLAADVAAFARTLVVAVRARQMYSGAHPVAAAAADRCRPTIAPLAAVPGLVLGVTPATLRLNGEPLPPDIRVREAAALLNAQDIVALRFAAVPTDLELANFLLLLTFDSEAVRAGGGPAGVWDNFGHTWLQIDQIEYDALLTPVSGGSPPKAGIREAESPGTAVLRDHVWDALVRSVGRGHQEMDVASEQRLLQVARSVDAIEALAADAAASCGGEGADGHRAAALLTTLQRLVSLVEREAPADAGPTVDRVADAAGRMDPALVMRTMAEAAESGVGTPLIKAIGEQFSDDQLATLVAAAMAAEGKATGRMAAALSTLAPDAARQTRVLRLARVRAEDRGAEAAAAWTALGKFLEGPDDAAYVSQMYGESLGQAEARSHGLRLDAPPRIAEWLATVSAESVRTLSATVLLDLFGLEDKPDVIEDTARDLAALADDLLLAGDTTEASRVVTALAAAAACSDPDRARAGGAGIDELLGSPALRELAAMAGDLDAQAFDDFERICAHLGPRVIEDLVSVLVELPEGLARARLAHAVSAFRDEAVTCLCRSLGETDAEHSRLIIHMMRELGTAHAVAALEAITHDGHPDHVRAAIHELATMEDDGASRALDQLLRSGSTGVRHAVIDALAASRPRCASVLLAGALAGARLVGQDHEFAKRTLAALRLVGDADAVPAIAEVMQIRSLVAWRRAGRLRRLAAAVLLAMRIPEAAAACDAAARDGGMLVRRALRAAGRG